MRIGSRPVAGPGRVQAPERTPPAGEAADGGGGRLVTRARRRPAAGAGLILITTRRSIRRRTSTCRTGGAGADAAIRSERGIVPGAHAHREKGQHREERSQRGCDDRKRARPSHLGRARSSSQPRWLPSSRRWHSWPVRVRTGTIPRSEPWQRPLRPRRSARARAAPRRAASCDARSSPRPRGGSAPITTGTALGFAASTSSPPGGRHLSARPPRSRPDPHETTEPHDATFPPLHGLRGPPPPGGPGRARPGRHRAALAARLRRACCLPPDSELTRLNADPRPAPRRGPRALGLWAAEQTAGLVDPTLLDELERPSRSDPPRRPSRRRFREALAVAPPPRSAGRLPLPPWSIADDRAVRRPPHLAQGGDCGLSWSASCRALQSIARATCASAATEAGWRPFQIDVHSLGGEVVHRLRLGWGAVATSSWTARLWRTSDGGYAHHLIDPHAACSPRPRWPRARLRGQENPWPRPRCSLGRLGRAGCCAHGPRARPRGRRCRSAGRSARAPRVRLPGGPESGVTGPNPIQYGCRVARLGLVASCLVSRFVARAADGGDLRRPGVGRGSRPSTTAAGLVATPFTDHAARRGWLHPGSAGLVPPPSPTARRSPAGVAAYLAAALGLTFYVRRRDGPRVAKGAPRDDRGLRLVS